MSELIQRYDPDWLDECYVKSDVGGCVLYADYLVALRVCEQRILDAAVQRLEDYLQHDVADGWMLRSKAEGIIAVLKRDTE